MKINFDKQKGTKLVTNLVNNTVDLSKKVATSTKDNVTNLVEKTKQRSIERKLKKLNPLFPEEFNSAEFKLPNMIMIVDDAVRRDIELCNGAIGWINKDTNTEVLFLYDEAVEFSKLKFIPSVTCDAIYYVDSFDRNKFIRTDCIFNKAHEERLAELKHIAYSLGAKRCSIEIVEADSTSQKTEWTAKITETYSKTKVTEGSEQSSATAGQNKRSGKIKIEFEGSCEPQKPKLKWFQHDDTIKNLIDMRCSNKNAIKNELLELSGSSSATMSQKTAHTIDSAVKSIGGASGQVSMNSQASKEHHSKLLFSIEF